MKYFINCESLDAAKILYYSLAKVLHPDKGGKTQDFQNLQNEFEKFKPSKEKFTGEFDQWQSRPFMTIIDELMKLPNIIITVCGSWIWVSGNTKPVKDNIKQINCFESGYKLGFSKNKLQWYFSPSGYRKLSKKRFSFDEIKNMYGYEDVKSSYPLHIA